MKQTIRRIWKAAPIATVLLVLALAAGVFFGARAVSGWIYWNDPAHRDQAIAGWMTPGYIAHSWNVPRGVVLDALEAPRGGGGPRNLDRLAQDQQRPLAELIAEAEAAIAAFRTAAPDATGQPPATGE